MTQGILIAALVIGGVGLFVGCFLGFASHAFRVPVNEKEEAIKNALPGANCGGCGYAGCNALAEAIVSGDAPVTACVVGQKATADEIAGIMGVDAEPVQRMVAFVGCSGDCEKTNASYEYTGQKSCMMAQFAPGNGPKSCRYGCEGFGDCVRVCEYGAISIQKGIAVVDKEKCRDCRKCMSTCPRKLIVEVPYDSVAHIACHNPLKGKSVMCDCKTGCITCQKCMKNCPAGAIEMQGGFPVIRYNKCTNCHTCKDNCPRHCIV